MLLFVDPIDAWVADALEEYDGCKLRAIDEGDHFIVNGQKIEGAYPFSTFDGLLKTLVN